MDNKKNEILKRRSKLSPMQRELLEKRLRGEVDSHSQLKVIPRRSQTSPAPLSFAQQRLWFLYQLDPDSAFYNEFAYIHLNGLLNVIALEQSLNEIVRRHEALRTTFATVDEQPVQIIHPILNFKLPIIDFTKEEVDIGDERLSTRKLLEEDQQSFCTSIPFTIIQNPSVPLFKGKSKIQNFILEEVQRPFDLNTGPLHRLTLLRLDEAEHLLLLTVHHIVIDGWSMGVFIRELKALYEAFSCAQPSPLHEPPIQYVDFAIWQRQWLEEEGDHKRSRLQTQLIYWQQQLKNLPILHLPTDQPQSAVQSYRGAKQFFLLPKALLARLEALIQQEDVTLFMMLLAAFGILLYRYTDQDDIPIGSPIANRNCEEIEGLIGFFVNTLVLRADLSGNPTFQELLGRIRKMTLEAYAYQDMPFAKLVEELQPERDLNRQPLFQVVFVLQNAPMPTLELPGLSLELLEVDNKTSKFDLTLTLTKVDQGLSGTLEYSTDLFDKTTIFRMLGHFQTLLEGIVANPKQRLKDLPLLTETEKYQLLVEWNKTQADYPQHECIHQLFEAQVEQTPDNVAVVFDDQQLTYRELNVRANQLAHYLQQKLGVRPEVLVGICVERSLDMVIGLLGILKAGGAYVPLDPAYPKERLAFMLENSQPNVLLTQQYLVENLPTHEVQVVCIDSNWKFIAQEKIENPGSNITADNLAYVIYTSGSTGRPKGAMNTHRGISNRLLWMQDAYQLTVADKVLQKTPFSFDVSVWEFFWPLITGACLVVAQPEGHRDTNYLVNLITQQQITTLHFVPSMLRLFLEAENIETCKCLKRVIASGEVLPVQLQKGFFNRLDAELYNLYGPTEAAVDVTYWACIHQSSPEDNSITHQKTVPIGHPIANIQIYLLDEHLNPVPVGITGEVYIGGVGVGRGYLNSPELTAQRFIPNLFSKQSATRLYKTGDLARYLPNGEREYIGRIDHQVKLRGFRIELGEIEALLSQHPAVRETLVVVREDSRDSQRMVAYVVPHAEQTLTIAELRRFLESKVPNYMIPSAFVMLEALPLTPNGKVDRNALPAPNGIRPELEKAFIAPQTTVEKQLAVIWEQVLGFNNLGINDNFFDLGGDSILSLQIISKANLAGLHLTPKQLFQHQTIAQLASVAGTTKTIQAEQGVITGSLALTPIQHWFFEQQQPEPDYWNQAVLLEVKQSIDRVVLEQVMQSLQGHHDALRLRFLQEEFGTQAVIVSPDNVVPIRYLDLSAQPKEEQAAAIEGMAAKLQASLNLSEGPLFRVALFDLGEEQPSRLLWAIHHLAVDGVSWRILFEDFQTAYQQLCQGKEIQLPPKTTSFKQWSHRLQEYAQSSGLHSELEYWLTSKRQSVKPIPVDYPYANNTETTACTVSVSLCVQETQLLLQQVSAAYQTQINDILLTALTQTFAQWTGASSLLIDLEGHGREELLEDVDVSRTVGWFTSIFPVHLSLENATSPGKALMAIKEQLRAIPNRGIGYGVLYYLSRDKEITSRLSLLPKAEVIFNYLGQFDQVLPKSSLFSLAHESSGPSHSLRSLRTHLLEINGSIFQGRLQINWTYSQKLHQQTTVEALAQRFIEAVRSLIAHCLSPDTGGFTPSDFPDVELSQEKLDNALAEIDFS